MYGAERPSDPEPDPSEVNDGRVLSDAICMNEDSSHLLDRYYWFTVEDGCVTVVEERPRDSYHEP
jgi:phenylalanine-4-hydroxylase